MQSNTIPALLKEDVRHPLCIAFAFMGMTVEDMIRLEMGWALPDKEKLDGILAAMSFFYGFDPLQFFRLIKRGNLN